MALINWTSIANGDTLSNIRTSINSFNSSVVSQVNANTTAIANNTSTTNTNTANIATNTNSIADIDTRTTALEASIPTYDYIKTAGQSVTSDVYTEVARLTTVSRNIGVYEYKFSMTFSYDNTNRSSFFRFSIDGGVNWSEFAREPKATTDNYHMYYAFPIYRSTEEPIDLIVEARCENSSDTITISYLDIVAESKS